MTEAAGGPRSGGARARRGRRVCCACRRNELGNETKCQMPEMGVLRHFFVFDTNLYGILYLLVVPVQKKEPK